jgi:hypothetical protein
MIGIAVTYGLKIIIVISNGQLRKGATFTFLLPLRMEKHYWGRKIRDACISFMAMIEDTSCS